MSEKFYVTTPIYYVNDEPHIGHLYTTIAADTLGRYHRALGHDVRFLTGTDEHGQKIEEAAVARGISPQALADEVVTRFQKAWSRADVHYDDFLRTTEPRHKEVVSAMWSRLQAQGDIYLAEYEGQYCVGCEEFYTETQAPDGRCPVHQRSLEAVKEESYFFRLSRYTQPLLEYYQRHPTFIRPENRYNEIVSFVKGGLRDISISRSKLNWGIPVPGDPRHVIYVWLDALTNYVSALGGADDPSGLYEKFWPADVQLLGKDILRFHAVYWPAFLLSAGLPLPRQLFVHGWWTVEGQKMSKSLGNVVRPDDLFDAYGVDATRYFLLREFPFGGDGDFSQSAITTRFNAELANDLGNLLNRTLAMVGKYLAEPTATPVRSAITESLAQACATAVGEYHRAMAELAFSRALESVFALVRAGNKFIDTHAPWALHKAGDVEKLREVLGAVCESLRISGALLAPFMPGKMAELGRQLGVGEAGLSLRELAFGSFGPFAVSAGTPLFARLEVKEKPGSAADDKASKEGKTDKVAKQSKKDKPANPGDAAAAAVLSDALPELRAEVGYEDFTKLDLRVGLIKSAERVKKSDKLLRLIVDIGEERQVVAGIGKRYAPEELVGKRVIVVANLRPVTLMGVESRGMLLAAGGEGDLELATFPDSVRPGTRVK